MKTKPTECAMDCARYLKGVSRVNTAKLALWAAMLAIVVVAGMAILNSGMS